MPGIRSADELDIEQCRGKLHLYECQKRESTGSIRERLSLTMVIQRTLPQDAAAMLAPAILETVDLPLLSLDRDLRIAGRYPVEAFGSTLLEQHSSGQPIVVCNVSRAHAGAELESFTQLGIAAYIGVPWSRTAASSRV